jgi:hypothetical protein
VIPPNATGRSSRKARFNSFTVTARTAFPRNLVFCPVAAAFAPPTGDFQVLSASYAGYVVLPGLFQFEEAGQAELTLHSFTPSLIFK